MYDFNNKWISGDGWLVVFVLWHINFYRLFKVKYIFKQIISSFSNYSVYHECTVLLSQIYLFQVIQFSQTVLIQTIQFSMSTDFAYMQLNVITVILKQFSTVSISKTVTFPTIQFSISTQFSSIWHVERALTSATIQDQSGSGADGNEGILRILQSSSIFGTSLSDCFVSYQDAHFGVLPLCRDAVDLFSRPSQLDKNFRWEGTWEYLQWISIPHS